MTLDDFPIVVRAAHNSIQSLLEEWFPKGRIVGVEFCVGSVAGEEGQSLRIRLRDGAKAKAGVWSDFAAGEAGGDLISLYAYKNGLTPGKACAELAAKLGIQLTESDSTPRAPKTARPILAKPKTSPNPAPAQAGKGVEAPAEEKKRTPWSPILPVPDDAGPYPKAHVVRGKPEAHWEYRDAEGRLLGVIYRFIRSKGEGKEVLPCVFATHPDTGKREWRWMAFPEPRPLYLRGPHRPELPLLVVEGEKCADAGVAVIGDECEVITWSGGGKAVGKSDWSSIRDRNVILWPDTDAKVYKEGHEHAGQIMPEHEQPGMVAMNQVAEILRAQGCSVFFVDIPAPGAVPDGWDVADLVDGGAGAAEVLAWATKLRQMPEQADAAPADDEPADDVPSWVAEQMDEQLADASTPSPAGAGRRLDRAALRKKLIPTASGGIKGCRENVYMITQNDERLHGLVGLDLFSGLQMKLRKAPWPSTPGEWTEADDFHLGMYMAEKYGMVVASISDIERGVAQAAREHSFDPVVDYLDRCADTWDGQKRVATAFSRYWGATDSEYLRLVSTMFFVGLVMRGYRPGVKNDHAPVFEGGQGRGKSTALKVLGGGWFADTPFRMGDKDGYLSIQGILLYEVAELEQFNRSELTAVKAFMSSTTDRFREPYGRRMKNVPRRCAFAATTNEDQYFKDPTGNRRFWPVETGFVDIDALVADRDQLYGEAVMMMNAGVHWWPTFEQQHRLIGPVQEDREIPDPWRGRIWQYLEGVDMDGKPSMAGKVMKITILELLIRALHFDLSKLGPAKSETTRVGTIMKRLGWIKRRESSGARDWYYERPPAAADEGALTESAGEGEDVVLPF